MRKGRDALPASRWQKGLSSFRPASYPSLPRAAFSAGVRKQANQFGLNPRWAVEGFDKCLPLLRRSDKLAFIRKKMLGLQTGAIEDEVCDAKAARFRTGANQFSWRSVARRLMRLVLIVLECAVAITTPILNLRTVYVKLKPSRRHSMCCVIEVYARISVPSGNFKNVSRSACKVASENDMRAVLTTLDVPALKEHNP